MTPTQCDNPTPVPELLRHAKIGDCAYFADLLETEPTRMVVLFALAALAVAEKLDSSGPPKGKDKGHPFDDRLLLFVLNLTPANLEDILESVDIITKSCTCGQCTEEEELLWKWVGLYATHTIVVTADFHAERLREAERGPRRSRLDLN